MTRLRKILVSLDNLLTQVSEDSLNEELSNYIEQNFNEESFFNIYFDKNNPKENIKKLEFKRMTPAIAEEFLSNNHSEDNFFKNLAVDIPENEKDNLFNEVLNTYAKDLITDYSNTQALGYKLTTYVSNYALTNHKDWFKKIKDNPKKDFDYYVKNEKIVPFATLSRADEPIGTKSYSKSLDYDNRDYPFIILNNDLLIKGKHGQSHTQALHDFTEKYSKDNETYQQAEEELSGNWKRFVSKDVIENTLNSDSVCFGHVKNKMAFVDTWDNCSVDDVANLIKSELNVNKVYESTPDFGEWVNRRVARLVPKYNINLRKMNLEFINFYRRNKYRSR
jgi:hypothetical protein